MNADKGSALISQSMNADKGTAISRAKNSSFVVRNTLLPYIVFAKKKQTKALMRLRICAGSSESSLLAHVISTNSS